MKIKSVLFGIVLVALVAQTLGHSYLTSPTSRSNQKETQTGCRGPNCLGPCDRTRSAATRAPIAIQRGASINLQWPRNNHAGGFIRVAWAQKSQSDNHAAFDAGVQVITCHEVGGCHPDSASNSNGGDSAPADGSSRPCQISITVPTWLSNGEWTLQWAWFGGAFALGDYYSCVDYSITGGPTSSQTPATFIGGDYTYPGQNKCKFFNTDRLHQCVNEPCNNPIFALNQERSGPAYGVSVGTGNTPPPTPSPPTPSPPTPSPPTPSPPTPSPPTPSPPTPSPPTPSPPTPTPPTPSPPSGGACTLGHQKCAGSNKYQTCGWATATATGWSAAQSCPTGLSCHVVQGNYIWCY